jgi:class 3 adenylate cyclase/tetratricopeptide (TPR) repeat protein
LKQEQASLLVVDDNEMNRDILTRSLSHCGYTVTEADSGMQAQTLIEEQQFDLVLLDIMMPGISGLEVLKWIRSRNDDSDMPVIMTTAKVESEDIVGALKLGANDYVTKPIDISVLMARIKTQLSSKSTVDSLRQDYRKLEKQVKKIVDKPYKASVSTHIERKYVTVLFSDLSGYTAMSERLDPEEVKEIMSAVLGTAHRVITRHGGYTEKFLGDAVMAVFGKENTYEDDPIRAIKAALEIQKCVSTLSIADSLKRRIGTELSMHSGINTGVVITNSGAMNEGAETILGDTVNLASRLTSLAQSGQVLVSSETYQLTQGYFNFEEQKATTVKGKARPVRTYKVRSIRSRPSKIHRLTGHRSKLIGRSTQLNDLKKACQNVLVGKGSTYLVYGPAGTGKSRLIEECREKLKPGSLQWLQSNAFQNNRDTPYSLFIDFLRRLWHIKESDTTETIKEKLTQQIEQLTGNHHIVPYLGHLFGIEYPQTKKISPQFWKSEFVKSMQRVIELLALSKPTIICFEDIQWADNASLYLLRSIISDATHPALIICSYSTPFVLFASLKNRKGKEKIYQEIKLFDLSHVEVEVMVRSLLDTLTLPEGLTSYIEENVSGNPFYVEELVNSLVESAVLVKENDNWILKKQTGEAKIPSTIHGVISARLHHLDNDNRVVLQEAAVIGKKFQLELLKRVSRFKGKLEQCLEHLEHDDLIRTYSLQPEVEYVFKHALIQEVVYDSLLLGDRVTLHKRIAQTIESDFSDQLPDFYETLAHHYRFAKVRDKTVDYLVLSAEKSLNRHAVEEAHHYFKNAFDLLVEIAPTSTDAQNTLVNLLCKWAIAHFFKGDFKGLLELFNSYKAMAESLDDQQTLGFYYAWFGKALYYNDRNEEAYQYLRKALLIGEDTGNEEIIGYASSSLLFTCKDRGALDEATIYGERAINASTNMVNDPVVFTRTLVGLGDVYFFRGRVNKILEVGNTLFKYADEHPASGQAVTSSHVCFGLAHSCSGNFAAAIESFENAIKYSVSPYFAQWPKLWLANAYILNGQIEDADKVLRELVEFCRENGVLNLITLAEALSGVVLCHKKQMEHGLEMIKRSRDLFHTKGLRIFYIYCEYFLGKVNLQIFQHAHNNRLSMLGKEIQYVFKVVPTAGQDAKKQFKSVIQDASDMDALGMSGLARLDLARLYELKGKSHKAMEYFRSAIEQFRECEATTYMDMASHELQSIEEA